MATENFLILNESSLTVSKTNSTEKYTVWISIELQTDEKVVLLRTTLEVWKSVLLLTRIIAIFQTLLKSHLLQNSRLELVVNGKQFFCTYHIP